MVEFSGCYQHRPTYYTDISSGPLGSVYSYKVKGEGHCFGFHNELNPHGPNNGVFTEVLIISRIQTKNYQKIEL